MSTDGPERRKSERMTVNPEFEAVSRAGRIAYVSDLSETGVFVHTDQLVPIGTRVALRFTVIVDDPVVISGQGVVMRHSHDPRGVGVQFENLTPQTVLRVSDVLARQRRNASVLAGRTGPQAAATPAADEVDEAKTSAFPRVDASIASFESGEFELIDDDDATTVASVRGGVTRRLKPIEPGDL